MSLSVAVQRNLHGRKPSTLWIEGEMMLVRDWSDLCEKFVLWLVDNGHLTLKRSPVLNHAGRDKYFINTKPDHLDSNKDADWHEVAGFYVDTKYAAKIHIKNLISALEQLGLGNLKVEIGIP